MAGDWIQTHDVQPGNPRNMREGGEEWVFLHEHLHVFAGGKSKEFTRALTHLLSTVICKRDRLDKHEAGCRIDELTLHPTARILKKGRC